MSYFRFLLNKPARQDILYSIETKKVGMSMQEQTNRHLKYTLGTLAVERLTPSKHAVRLCAKLSEGKISVDQALRSVKEKYTAAAK